jgi:hypothetical protein
MFYILHAFRHSNRLFSSINKIIACNLSGHQAFFAACRIKCMQNIEEPDKAGGERTGRCPWSPHDTTLPASPASGEAGQP